ncbi:flagellar hook assembly protein FlgD [Sphingomonas sp. 37zxx]|uniref:flagellar hook assembly protein FlgD n=1 Tax=Sphingomonas sp. 37zxx TaxID=1550073 RepID=UPI00053BE70E|nr:flagellar hook capping FlgD N-terminal domain-containing protein [Sphingomonas sp. 37zxx]
MTIIPSTATSAITNPAAAAPNNVLGAEFNMFLKLLTTQMQNQDPLSPMDSTQYTQQLAQYSQVEQTVQQTATLKDILARLSTQDMSQAAGFIGKEAVFASSVSGLGSQPASWAYTATGQVSSGTAVVTDATGKVVLSRALDGGAAGGKISWDGVMADGTKAPAGAYTLSIRAINAAGASIATTITSSGTVNDVSSKNGALSLGVNGVSLPISALIRLAEATN